MVNVLQLKQMNVHSQYTSVKNVSSSSQTNHFRRVFIRHAFFLVLSN